MDTIDRTVLTELARHTGWPAVSISLTTHVSASETEHDRLRLKNLLTTAASRLVADGMRAPDADVLLADASARLTDPAFWATTAHGLALFITPAATRVYRVAAELPEEVVVGDRFHLRPLALAYRGDEYFFALALDRTRTRLFAGDRSGIRELPIEGAPTSFAESTRFDQREESLQYSTHASPESIAGAGRTIGMFHGHGGENADKTELERFVGALERAVTRTIGAQGSIPLVLLGVDYQLALYRTLNTYGALVAEQAIGATDELPDREIHARALAALEPYFSAQLDAELAELREARGALVSDDVHEIVTAAAAGRVKTLFFDEALGPFGHFDRDRFAVDVVCDDMPAMLREERVPGMPAESCGWDLVDLALAETVLHGGDVHAFIGEGAPVEGVAAVLRY